MEVFIWMNLNISAQYEVLSSEHCTCMCRHLYNWNVVNLWHWQIILKKWMNKIDKNYRRKQPNASTIALYEFRWFFQTIQIKCDSLFYHIQKLFFKWPCNPISIYNYLVGDVRFIITTHYFPFVFSGRPLILSADHKPVSNSSVYDKLQLWKFKRKTYSLFDLHCRSQIRKFQKLVWPIYFNGRETFSLYSFFVLVDPYFYLVKAMATGFF